MSVGLSLVDVGIGTRIPLFAAAAHFWLLYCVFAGTIEMGFWVIAYKCGHLAFHPNRRIEGTVGFALHSILLVPYYSWEHSHAKRCITPTAITLSWGKPTFHRGRHRR